MEDVLHGASVGLEDRYEALLQFILAKIYDEHQAESTSAELEFQDYESLGVSPKQASENLNAVLTAAVAFYSAHLPRPIDDRFQLKADIVAQCAQILAPTLITSASKEVIQVFYMKFAKDLYRWDLAQYFTPPTVTDFIVEVLNPCAGETVKDPACGSADFLVATFHRSRARKIKNASEMAYGADNDPKAVQISVLNMLLNGDGKTNIQEEDSLLAVAEAREKLENDKKFRPVLFNAVVCNPPFGLKIVEKRQEVLRRFDLGHLWEQDAITGEWVRRDTLLPHQQKGILFAEVCIRQARPKGRIAIILPNGYLGNRSEVYTAFREWLLRHCRVAAICGFPRFTFKTSGADVSASVVFLEKREKPLADSSQDRDYMFNVELIENVGWSVGDKNALPTFVRSESDGSFLVGPDGQKVILSDFAATLQDIRTSPAVAEFPWLVRNLDTNDLAGKPLGWGIEINAVLADAHRTLDPKRHSRKYAALVSKIEEGKCLRLTDIFDVVPQGARTKSDGLYRYVDIENIGAGDFRATEMRGWQLPTRAKHFAEPMDVFVGSIWSSVSKWCIMPLRLTENTMVTNGCHRLRLKEGKRDKLVDACAFFCSEAYTTQMRALARGSDGLAEINEDDLALVRVPILKDNAARERLAEFVDALLNGSATLKGAVSVMLADAKLAIPQPRKRPHHSSLV